MLLVTVPDETFEGIKVADDGLSFQIIVNLATSSFDDLSKLLFMLVLSNIGVLPQFCTKLIVFLPTKIKI